MERETGIEPATSSLGSWRSTAELLPLRFHDFSSHRQSCKRSAREEAIARSRKSLKKKAVTTSPDVILSGTSRGECRSATSGWSFNLSRWCHAFVISSQDYRFCYKNRTAVKAIS